MTDSADKLTDAAAAMREIEHLQNEAVMAVAKNDFYVGAGTTDKADVYTHYAMDPTEMPAIRAFVLGAIWRQITLRVQRCAAVGVTLSGWSDKEAWVADLLLEREEL